MRLRTFFLSSALLLSLLGCLNAQTPPAPPAAPTNLDFEQGQPGEVPPGWFVPTPSTRAGYTVKIVTEKPEEGRQAVQVAFEGQAPDRRAFGNLMTTFDAAAFRGKRVRFRAAVRAEVFGPGNQAALWLRVDREGGAFGFFDNMGNRPVTSAGWKDYEIVGDVAPDAKTVNIGFMLLGTGKAWIDSASFEALGQAGAGNEPARPLSARGLENLAAFTRLLGYVRYFHPSDQAASADWEKLALAGVQKAEKAAGPEELARALEDLFRPVAPTVRVYPTGGERPAIPAGLAPPAGVEAPEVVAWEHRGVTVSAQPSIYKSRRVGAQRAAPAADPGEPFVAGLGGGVSAMIPLALYKDGEGTLPHVAPEVLPPSPDKPEGFTPSGNDRTTRLADVALAWNVFQHFYPYFDVVKTDWPAELRRALSSAATDKDDLAFLDTLRRLVAAIRDGHGGVYYQGNLSRLPLLWDWVEDQLVVTKALAGAGELRRGDVILTLDGRPAREALEGAEELISGATPQWRRYRGLGEIAGCGERKQVRLEARRPTGEAFTATVSCALPSNGEALEEDRPEKIAEVRPGIFYVDMDRVGDEDFKGAVDRLAAAKGVVFDLRGYPGDLSTIVIAHLTGETVTSARWNVPRVHRPDRADMAWEFSNWPVEPAEPRIRGKAAFLTDGRAISYAETYLGIIEHYKLAAIVGGPTAGTNGNVNPFALPGGYQVVWTGMKVLKHDGSQHHGIGIQPTVPASRTLKGVADGRDELLEKAIEVVSRP